MKTIQELVPLIQEWAKERGIFDKSTPFDQLLKTHEEVGELIKACYDNDKPAVQDAIGDTMICLLNYCYFTKTDFLEVYKQIKYDDRDDINIYCALNVNDIISFFLRDVSYRNYNPLKATIFSIVINILRNLQNITINENTTLEECLNIAYNEIKHRKGKIINRKFIKDEK
jgi:hypothetical protein|nr:MAG TPA: NTP-PPase-like protein [Caudoviricetes sp.]DAS81404.1 MAG TPA: NTP-PPase-like protein [Caudoviricetes sp.]